MKTIQLAILLLISPFAIFAQSLTGLWVGSVSNDSTTIRKDQSFEIVLTQYKDKVYGYSRSTFIVNDTLYYIVKRVKGDIEGDVCEVKDDDIISHNFPHKPDKGVKMISTFRRNQSDSIWRLDGDWKTTESKKHRYYSISGKINLKTESDLEKSKIFPHLEELNLANDVAFYKESKQKPEPVAAIIEPARINKKDAPAKPETSIARINDSKKAEVSVPVKSEPVAIIQKPKDNNQEQNLKEETQAVVSNKEIKKDDVLKVQAKSEPVATNRSPVTDTKKQAAVTGNPIKSEPVAAIKQPAKNIEKEQVLKEEKTVPVQQPPQKTEAVAVAKTAELEKKVIPKVNDQPVISIAKVSPAISQAATLVAQRKIAPPQTVFFKSDSLELSLYDNGEIDGDTVSVLLNGEIILAKQGLKASAIKKTIYFIAGRDDSLTLVLYAENLGKYPPNTGLLVVHDGDDVYQVRFSADLQQNAAVIFRRKRN